MTEVQETFGIGTVNSPQNFDLQTPDYNLGSTASPFINQRDDCCI
jgi:hypothetical protein